jgi:hypothetical protein
VKNDERWLGRALVVVALAASACSKPSSEQGSAASSASVSSAVARPGASASAGSATAASPAGAAAVFAGSYLAKQGAVDSPTKEKTWTEDTGSDAVGKGSIELSVDGPPGDAKGPPRKVVGQAKGPLGPMSITGTFDGKEVRANMAPTEGNAPGAMTGFMTLTADGPASLKGTLRVASGNARIVREATVELARK